MITIKTYTFFNAIVIIINHEKNKELNNSYHLELYHSNKKKSIKPQLKNKLMSNSVQTTIIF